MRKVIQEPGFWMMVFGTVILAMFLFAGNGNCDDSKTTVTPEVVTEECVRDCESVLIIESEEEATLLMLLVNYFKSGGM